MTITLIRHSKTNPTKDIPIKQWGLTQSGIVSAQSLSKDPDIRSINVFYSSLQTKALETAIILAKDNGIPIKTDDKLTEISSFTEKFDDNPEIYEKNTKHFYNNIIERIENGETWKEALARFNKALEEITRKEEGTGNIGIVSHGHILTYFSSQFLFVDRYELHKEIKMPDIAVLDWDNKKFIRQFNTNINYD